MKRLALTRGGKWSSRKRENGEIFSTRWVRRIGPAAGPIGVMVSGWCPCVPLGRRQSSTQQQQQQQQQPPSSSRAPFTVSGATDRADMVQMFYYENRGKCCKKLLRYNGYPNKVRQLAIATSFRDMLSCVYLCIFKDPRWNLFAMGLLFLSLSLL